MKASAWSVPRAQTLPWLPEKPIGANKKIKDYTPAEIIQQITREQVTAIIMALTPQQLAEMITRLQAIYIVQAVPIDQIWSVLTEQQKQQAAIQVIGDNLLTPIEITGWGTQSTIIPISSFSQATTTTISVPAGRTLSSFGPRYGGIQHSTLCNNTTSAKNVNLQIGDIYYLSTFGNVITYVFHDTNIILQDYDSPTTDQYASTISFYNYFSLNFT